MCLLRITNISRPIISNDIILLKDEAFERLRDETYFRVLSSDKRGEEISKSYFYFIVDKLRHMGLLLDNALAFKAVIPYRINGKGLSLIEGILYVTNKKELIYFNYFNNTYTCGNCSVLAACVPALKEIAYELGIKIRNDNPNLAWYKILENIQTVLISNSISLRLKLGEIPFGEKICCEKEVEEKNEPSANL